MCPDCSFNNVLDFKRLAWRRCGRDECHQQFLLFRCTSTACQKAICLNFSKSGNAPSCDCPSCGKTIKIKPSEPPQPQRINSLSGPGVDHTAARQSNERAVSNSLSYNPGSGMQGRDRETRIPSVTHDQNLAANRPPANSETQNDGRKLSNLLEKIEELDKSIKEITNSISTMVADRQQMDRVLDQLGGIASTLEALKPLVEFETHAPWQGLPSVFTESFKRLQHLIVGFNKEENRANWSNIPFGISSAFSKSTANINSSFDAMQAKLSGLGEQLDDLVHAVEVIGTKRAAQSKPGAAIPAASSNMIDLAAFDQLFVRMKDERRFKLLKNLPRLFDTVDERLKEWTIRQTNGDTTEISAVISVLQEIRDLASDWQARNYLVRLPEVEDEAYDREKHQRMGEVPASDPALAGRIQCVKQSGYLFDDGNQQVLLRKPEVIVWAERNDEPGSA